MTTLYYFTFRWIIIIFVSIVFVSLQMVKNTSKVTQLFIRALMLCLSLNADGLLTYSSVFFFLILLTNRQDFGLYKSFQKHIFEVSA